MSAARRFFPTFQNIACHSESRGSVMRNLMDPIQCKIEISAGANL